MSAKLRLRNGMTDEMHECREEKVPVFFLLPGDGGLYSFPLLC